MQFRSPENLEAKKSPLAPLVRIKENLNRGLRSHLGDYDMTFAMAYSEVLSALDAGKIPNLDKLALVIFDILSPIQN